MLIYSVFPVKSVYGKLNRRILLKVQEITTPKIVAGRLIIWSSSRAKHLTGFHITIYAMAFSAYIDTPDFLTWHFNPPSVGPEYPEKMNTYKCLHAIHRKHTTE